MNRLIHDPYIQMEQPLLKVPLEQLKKANAASQKLIDKQLKTLQGAYKSLNGYHRSGTLTNAELAEKYDMTIKHIKTFKAKLQELKNEEQVYLKRIEVRIQHLEDLGNIETSNSPQFERWSRFRLDRVLLDYLLRNGYHNTGKRLTEEGNLQDFGDFELFEQNSIVEKALAQHSCTECLQWCSENKTSLKKIKSNLEFHLRMQEFIELSRQRDFTKAIAYSEKYLRPFFKEHARKIEQLSTIMCFSPETQTNPYKSLYSLDRWDSLILEFRKDSYQLHNLPEHPALALTLQAGLSALKTPLCLVHHNHSIDCPVCQTETFGKLATNLPFSHHTNSSLVCRLSGKRIDETNPPLALPNGMVYSAQAIQEQFSQFGVFKDPQTDQEYFPTQVKKVYIS